MRRSLDRRQTQIQNDETRLRTTICTVVDPLITINERGIIESVNPATERIFGYEEKELIGTNVSILMPEGEKRAHDGYLRRYVETEEPRIIGQGREVTCVRKSGEEFPADLSVNEMWVNDERKFVGLVRDITERKKADQQKSDFVSVVSHELRTPLTSIRGSLGLLMSPVAEDLPESARELLAIAVRNSDRLIRLINDILDLQKIESGEIAVNEEAIDVGSFLEHAVEDNQGIADTFGVTLVLTNDAPGEKVCADRDRLMQVITNLISNAVKFSPRGAAVELILTHAGDDLSFAVRDQGPGIPEEFQSKIFDRFSQADSSATRKQGGTGLGLSIAQSIIELHGGSLRFTTQEGQGTTFTFALPKASEFETSSSQVRRTKNRDGVPVLVCGDDEGMAGVA
jgi:PAS domain S-box-containing protein